jgi:hypothetical protein
MGGKRSFWRNAPTAESSSTALPYCFDVRPALVPIKLNATCALKRRKFFAHELPHHRCGDIFVVVTKNVPDACDLGPGDLWMTSFQLVRQVTVVSYWPRHGHERLSVHAIGGMGEVIVRRSLRRAQVIPTLHSFPALGIERP